MAYSPIGGDGYSPCEAVRMVIEEYYTDQFKIELYNEKHKPVVEHLEWNEQIGDIFYVENGEDYYDENGVLNKELFKDNEDLFI